MKRWLTIIVAVCPEENLLKEFEGPVIEAESFEEAKKICKLEYPYCEVFSEIN